jgi:hypothetical protein
MSGLRLVELLARSVVVVLAGTATALLLASLVSTLVGAWP